MSYQLSDVEKKLRDLMGDSFFSIKDAIDLLGANPTDKQIQALLAKLRALINAPVTGVESRIMEIAKTRLLIAPMLSIAEVRDNTKARHLPNGHSLFPPDTDWIWDSTFGNVSTEKERISWQLIGKNVIASSLNKTLQQQLALLGSGATIPTAPALVNAIIGYYLKTEKLLFTVAKIRTLSTCNRGYSICIGCSNENGLEFDYCSPSSKKPKLGIVSCRKFPLDIEKSKTWPS